MSIKDLTGKEFNFIKCLNLDHIENNNGRKKKIWKCQCRCGKIIYLSTNKIASGATKSCGCIINDFDFKSMRSPNAGKSTKGILFEKSTGRYRARIGRNGKTYHLGRFKNEIDALNLYKIAESFSSFEDFAYWYPNRTERYKVLQEICENNDVNISEIIESIFDNFLGHLYNNDRGLEEFIIEYRDVFN